MNSDGIFLNIIFRWESLNISSSSLSIADLKSFPFCSDYLMWRGYNNRQPTEDEIEFPIAYDRVNNLDSLKNVIN